MDGYTHVLAGGWLPHHGKLVPGGGSSIGYEGHKVIFVVCDNGGFAVINRLQVSTGGEGFDTLLRTARHEKLVRVGFVQQARSMGANAEGVESIEEFKEAFQRAREADRSAVIVTEVEECSSTEGGAWWEVGVPEVSEREDVRVARAEHEAENQHRRAGI